MGHVVGSDAADVEPSRADDRQRAAAQPDPVGVFLTAMVVHGPILPLLSPSYRTGSALVGHHAGVDNRDRDSGGRPQNARPRDAMGRPLPYGSPGVERVPDSVGLDPDEAL